MDCLFCKLLNGEIPTTFIYEDEKVAAFNDIDPKAPHHILIIPRKHIATLNDIENHETELIGHMMQTAKKIAADKGIEKTGYRVLMNCNVDGGQSVYHLHLHLLGGRRMNWPPG